MKLSIVTTLFHSEKTIEEFYKRIKSSIPQGYEEHEIIFVNDGSPDESMHKVIKIKKEDDRIKLIDLSRNFGHHQALLTGISYSSGQYVFLIDSDLEEPPETLPEFISELEKDDNTDVIYGIQMRRKGAFFERLSGSVFWKLINLLSDTRIPPNMLTARIMTRRYAEALKLYGEKDLLIAGIFSTTGFKQRPYPIKKLSTSPSTYTLRRKISLCINGVASFSSAPLKYIFYFGFFITATSSTYIAYLVYLKLFHGITVSGWTSIIIAICFFGGMIIFFLGIIGIYLSKLFNEVKNRPRVIIRDYHG